MTMILQMDADTHWEEVAQSASVDDLQYLAKENGRGTYRVIDDVDGDTIEKFQISYGGTLTPVTIT